jgi:hypothetical protein
MKFLSYASHFSSIIPVSSIIPAISRLGQPTSEDLTPPDNGEQRRRPRVPGKNTGRYSEMTLRAILVTLVLTAAGVALVLVKLGPGGLIYLAALGGSAVWLLPGPLAVATPAGAFGRRPAHASRQRRVREDSTGATVRVAVLALLVSALTVGWLVPLAYLETGRKLSRFQGDSLPVEQPVIGLEGLTLDQLFVKADSVPSPASGFGILTIVR